MTYGYLDESGTPGVATRPNDFLMVSLVLFQSQESAYKCSASIDRLRKKLGKSETYEFHLSRNSTMSKQEFVKLIYNLEFGIITIAVKKSGSRQFASYPKMAEYLLQEIKRRFPEFRLEMDANPTLYAELRRKAKAAGLHIEFKQVRSSSSNLVQLADYVVALSMRKLRGTPKAIEQYRPLIKKQVYFGEITR